MTHFLIYLANSTLKMQAFILTMLDKVVAYMYLILLTSLVNIEKYIKQHFFGFKFQHNFNHLILKPSAKKLNKTSSANTNH